MNGRLSPAEIQRIYRDEVERCTMEQFGHHDELVEPKGALGKTLDREDYPWGAVYYQFDENRKRIQPENGVTVMVHGGTKFPWSDPDLERLVNLGDQESIKEVARTVVLNKDTGSGSVGTAYLEDMAKNPGRKTVLVWFDLTRMWADANRENPHRQTREPYKGKSSWRDEATEEDFAAINERYIESFARVVLELIIQHQPAALLGWHTYDEYSNSTASTNGGVEVLGPKQTPRAEGMLCYASPYDGMSAGGRNSLAPDVTEDQPTLMSSDQLTLMWSTMMHYLMLVFDNDVHVAIDSPYRLPKNPVMRIFEQAREQFAGNMLNQLPVPIFSEVRKDGFDMRKYATSEAANKELQRRAQVLVSMIHDLFTGVRDPETVKKRMHSD